VYRLITDDSTAYKGSKSAKIIQSIASANASNVKAFYNNVPIEKNKTYTIAFWAKVDAKEDKKRDLDLTIQTINPVPELIFLKTITLDSVDWKEYAYTIPTKDIEGNVWIGLLVGLSNVDFWFDNFRFFEGEPSDEIKSVETFVTPINKMTVSWGHIKSLHLNARKARKTLEFSKDNDYHKCHSWFCASYYNFCWDHRSLRVEIGIREYMHRSPMMVLGVTHHIWSVDEHGYISDYSRPLGKIA
jgi:hypothetical protein